MVTPPGFSKGLSLHAISGDGRWLAAVHPRHDAVWLSVWSLPDLTCRAYQLRGWVQALSFSLDGSRLYLPEGPWDWAGIPGPSQEPLRLDFNSGFGPQEVTAPAGRAILKRQGQGTLEVHEISTGKMIRRLVGFPPNTQLVAFGPSRNLLLATPPASMPWVWNRIAPRIPIPSMFEGNLEAPIYVLLRRSSSRAVAWSGNGKWIAVGTTDGDIHLYAPELLEFPKALPIPSKEAVEPLKVLKGLDAPIRSLAFCKGGLTALDVEGGAAKWNLESDQPERAWKGAEGRGNAIQVARNGSWVLIGGLDGISHWSLPEVRRLGRFGTNHMGVVGLEVSRDSSAVAATFLDGTVAIYELPSGRERWSSQPSPEVAAGVAIHPSGTWLVTAHRDGPLIAWDLQRGVELKRVHQAAQSLAWSLDGKHLAAGHAGGVKLLDETLSPLTGPEFDLNFGWNVECT